MAKNTSLSSNLPPQGQISLFGAPRAPESFRKAVQAVHSIPRSPLSLVQRKLSNAWVKNAVESAPDPDGWWEIGIAAMARDIGFDSNNRGFLREAAEGLMSIIFEWDVLAKVDARVAWKASVLFPEIEITSETVRYQISSQMRQTMTSPDIYAMLDMSVLRRFRRAPTLAIWEFCVRFERIGTTAEVHWEKFRDMVLGAQSAQLRTYLQYKYFNAKVLAPAIAEINAESDHVIELMEARVGRRVTKIQFSIKRKSHESPQDIDGQTLELVGELVRLGVPQSEARKLCNTYSVATVKGAYNYTRKRMNDKRLAQLDNPAAYFRHALSNGYSNNGDTAEPEHEPRRTSNSRSIKEAFMSRQRNEAEAYFTELEPDDQAGLIETYNNQQQVTSLIVKKRAGKLAQTAFYEWLAFITWGEPSPEQLLEFAQTMLEQQGAPSSS